MRSDLRLLVNSSNGKSFVKDLFVDKPFRVVSVGQYVNDPALHLMMMSVSPGILDGDDYNMNIHVSQNALLELETQSYQRIFKMDGHATQDMTITLDEGASFTFIPHPVVPHLRSSFINKTRVYRHSNSTFVMSEIITCGRKLSGEYFQYELFQNLLEVFDEKGRLVLKDNVLLQPQYMPLLETGMLEGYSHQGSFVFLCTSSNDASILIEEIFEKFNEREEVVIGISQLGTPGFILRALGNSGEMLMDLFGEVKAMVIYPKKSFIC